MIPQMKLINVNRRGIDATTVRIFQNLVGLPFRRS